MYHFNIAEVLCQVAGLNFKEFGPTGEVIKIAPPGSNFAQSMGTHGSTVRSKVPNHLCAGSLVLLEGSPYNDIASARILLDAISGTGVGPLMIKDLNGTSLVTAEISYFDAPPGFSGKVEAGTITYPFTAVVQPSGFHQGSNRFLVAA